MFFLLAGLIFIRLNRCWCSCLLGNRREYLILRDQHIVTSNRKLIIFRHRLGSIVLYAASRTVCGLHYGEPHLGKVEEYAVLLDFCWLPETNISKSHLENPNGLEDDVSFLSFWKVGLFLGALFWLCYLHGMSIQETRWMKPKVNLKRFRMFLPTIHFCRGDV